MQEIISVQVQRNEYLITLRCPIPECGGEVLLRGIFRNSFLQIPPVIQMQEGITPSSCLSCGVVVRMTGETKEEVLKGYNNR